MFLRSLSLRGFKSFANKSVLKFEPGITSIVGPNGSGKSNITDAALWVLGEQRASTLRGSTMQDVIFSGSTTRQSLGVAEVSLVLDNSKGIIPIEYSEVTVLRRCYRSGESEYYLNGSPCRLIDIQEILSDSGLGREMYSIISQGKLDEVLNSKPEERRKLIEGAAGVSKHKKRKDKALRKMNSMGDNLTRAKDILKELNRQLIPLEKQAKNADVYFDMRDELKEAEVAIAVIELRGYQKKWEDKSGRLEEIKKKNAGFDKDYQKESQVIRDCEGELESRESVVGDINEHRRRTEGVEQQINSGLLLLEEKGRNLIERLSELRQKRYQDESRKKARTEELDRLEKERAQSDKSLGELYNELSILRKKTEQTKKESRSANDEYESLRKNLERARTKHDESKEALGESNTSISTAREQIDFLNSRKEAASVRESELSENIKASEGEVKKLRESLDKSMSVVERINVDVESLRDEVRKSALECEEANTENNRLIAKVAALDNLSNDLRQYNKTAENLLKQGKKTDSIFGRVEEFISVSKEYEKAMEVALSRDLSTLIAKDYREIFKAIDSLGGDDSPVSLIPAFGVGTEINPEVIDGAKRALDVVKFDKEISEAISLLLEEVYIVDDLEVFLKNGNRYPRKTFVSLKGEILTAKGVIRKGFLKDESLGLIGCKREIKELRERQQVVESNAKSKENALYELKDGLERTEKDRDDKREAIRVDEAREISLRDKIVNLKEQLELLNNESTELNEGIESAKEEINRSDGKLGQHSGELEKLKEKIVFGETELDDLQKKREGSIEREKVTTTALSQCQVGIASFTERQVHLKQQITKLTDEIKESDDAFRFSENVERALERLRSRIEPVHDLYTDLRLKAEEWKEILKMQVEDEYNVTKETRTNLKAAQERSNQLLGKINELKEDETKVQVGIAKIEAKVNTTIENLVDELQVPLEKALEIVPEDSEIGAYEEKAKSFRLKLAEIGTVNPMAAKEYKEISERHGFLTDQIDDLLKSKKSLAKVVSAIEIKIEEKFNATLKDVNDNLQKVFGELFPGGKVRLIEIEGDDLNEPGIDIEAQPHGKKLQSLSLLSGGEKALVGLAFLFAIYYTRPSPFYILDEVEAALDDVNLQRLINLLEKLKDETQFLIITHQRRSMEIADSLYGVSMQADGVSTLMSQKLSDIERQGGDGRREKELAKTAEIGS